MQLLQQAVDPVIVGKVQGGCAACGLPVTAANLLNLTQQQYAAGDSKCASRSRATKPNIKVAVGTYEQGRKQSQCAFSAAKPAAMAGPARGQALYFQQSASEATSQSPL